MYEWKKQRMKQNQIKSLKHDKKKFPTCEKFTHITYLQMNSVQGENDISQCPNWCWMSSAVYFLSFLFLSRSYLSTLTTCHTSTTKWHYCAYKKEQSQQPPSVHMHLHDTRNIPLILTWIWINAKLSQLNPPCPTWSLINLNSHVPHEQLSEPEMKVKTVVLKDEIIYCSYRGIALYIWLALIWKWFYY